MKIGRNDPCSCGSGKKYKKCCLQKLQDLAARNDGVVMPEELKEDITKAEILLELTLRTGHPQSLEDSISAWARILESSAFKRSEPEARLIILTNAGTAYWLHFESTGDSDDLQKAHDLYRDALDGTSEDSEKRAMRLFNLAKTLEARSRYGSNQKDLEVAITLLREAVSKAKSDSSERAGVLTALGSALLTHCENFNSPDALLNEAITYLEAAVQCVPEGWPDAPFVLMNLAVGTWTKFRRVGNRSDLLSALGYIRSAMKMEPPPHRVAQAGQVLGIILLELYGQEGDEKYLLEACGTLIDALAGVDPHSPVRPKVLNTLGTVRHRLFMRKGDLAEMEKSVANFQDAIVGEPGGSADLPGYVNNYAGALALLFERTGENRYLEEGLELLENAERKIAEESPDRALYVANKAFLLWHAFTTTREDRFLVACLENARNALSLTDPRSPEYPNRQIALGNALLARFENGKNETALDESIHLYEESRSRIQNSSPQYSGILNNLARAVGYRYVLSGSSEDLKAVPTLFKEAFGYAFQSSVQEGLRIARNWGDWSFEHERWDEATEAYGRAQDCVDRILNIQLVRAGKENWLRAAQGISLRQSYCLVRTGRIQDALMSLERNRARLLTVALERDRIDLESLKSADDTLHGEFLRIGEKLANLEAPAPTPFNPGMPFGSDIAAEVAKIRMEFDDVITRIRATPGFELFLVPPSFDVLMEQLNSSFIEGQVIVILVVTKKGSAAFFLAANNIAHILLDFNSDMLDETLLRRDNGRVAGGLLPAEIDFPETLSTELENALPIIGEQLIRPIMDELRRMGTRDLVLVPTGWLSLLPLHAAAYSSSERSRCLLDEVTISYASNLRSFILNTKLAKERGQGRLFLGIGNPLPNATPLKAAEIEVRQIAEIFNRASGDTKLLCGEEATRDALLDLIGGADFVHFACHGLFDSNLPVRSKLELADGQELSLWDLMYGTAKPQRARLVVLSACQTAITDFKLIPDEVVGMPTAFIQAGAPGVIGTLWPVNSYSSALLMVRFYEFLLEENETLLFPAEALRRAQLWMRGLTDSELDKYMESHNLLMQISHLLHRIPIDSNRRSFSDPYHWAPFVFVGA